MNDEPRNLALTEETCEAIIFTMSAATCDPKPAIVRLLKRYLAGGPEQEYSDIIYDQDLEEHNQQN